MAGYDDTWISSHLARSSSFEDRVSFDQSSQYNALCKRLNHNRTEGYYGKLQDCRTSTHIVVWMAQLYTASQYHAHSSVQQILVTKNNDKHIRLLGELDAT
jgi:hypothetical protein